MSEFPYTQVAGKLKVFLDRIPDTGVPARLTQQELAARGFKSTNDRTILGVLKALGLLSNDGATTPNWQAYRNKATNRALLAQLIKAGYPALYDVYPDAHLRSDAEIRNLMSSKSKAGDRALSYMVQTFKALVVLADFGAEPVEVADTTSHASGATLQTPRRGGGLTTQIHLNLQVHIPDQADALQIDTIFKSMAKHLFGREADE